MELDLVAVWDHGLRTETRFNGGYVSTRELQAYAGIEEPRPMTVQAYAINAALRGVFDAARKYAASTITAVDR